MVISQHAKALAILLDLKPETHEQSRVTCCSSWAGRVRPQCWDDDVMSRDHAWSASPLYHLSQQALGVKSVAPG